MSTANDPHRESGRRSTAGLDDVLTNLEHAGASLFRWAADEGWTILEASGALQRLGLEDCMAGPCAVSYAERLHPADLPSVRALTAAGLVQRIDPIVLEYRLLTPRGEERWVREYSTPHHAPDGTLESFTGIVVDLTEQRRAELALDDSTRTLGDIAESVPGGIYQYDEWPDGRIAVRFLSEDVGGLIGLANSRIESSPLTALARIDAGDRVRLAQVIVRARQTGKPFDTVFRVRIPGCGPRWVSAHATSRPLGDGATRCTGILFDVTALQTAQLELAQAREEAERANAAKGEFLATMSHEIRTPLQAVTGFAELLGGTKLDEDQKLYVATILDQVRSVTRLINDILDFSKLQSGRMEFDAVPFSPADEAAAALSALQAAAAEKGLVLAGVFDRCLPARVLGDPLRFRQILTNLVGNAVKFTRAGRVDVRVYVGPSGAAEPADTARVVAEVADTGPGIPPETLAMLFNRFAQGGASVARQHGGSGLGLAISRLLAQGMGGDVTVTSILGQGSTFRAEVRLERLAERTVAVPEPAGEEPADERFAARHPLRIAVVDDNRVGLTVGRLLLQRIGYKAATFESGLAFLEAVERDGARFDLVFMDVRMPELDGFGTTERLLRWCRTHQLPPPVVVGLTADVLPAVRQQCFDAGMTNFLTKPTQVADILGAARAAHAAATSRTAPAH